MDLIALKQEEVIANEGATHKAILTHADLTETAVSTAQTIGLASLSAKMSAKCLKAQLITPFSCSTDSANNSTALEVGDDGSVARLLASMELNENGTEVFLKKGTGTDYVFTAANYVDAYVTPASGKALSALDAGEVHIFLQITDGR